VLVEHFEYRLPLAIDALDNKVEAAFAAWPERLYVLDPGGKVIFKGGMGPFGFDTDAAEKALRECLGR
jgi:Iodothyronine deiodinase